MSVELQNLLAKKFIARSDVKAEQQATGAYFPVREHQLSQCENCSHYIGWSRNDLDAHLHGVRTFGHYLVNTDDKCKVLAFDIDLAKEGYLPEYLGEEGWEAYSHVPDLRAAWLHRATLARPYMKTQFNLMAAMLAKAIEEILGLETAVAYSGNKGVHVYGFLPSPDFAANVREGGMEVLDQLGRFEAAAGGSFYNHVDRDPATGFPNLSIELFPKQGSLEGKDLGNLMRLPLGKNQKSSDPTFFMDFTGPFNEFSVRDPLVALSGQVSLWAREGE